MMRNTCVEDEQFDLVYNCITVTRFTFDRGGQYSSRHLVLTLVHLLLNLYFFGAELALYTPPYFPAHKE